MAPVQCSFWLVAPAEPPDPTEIRFGKKIVLRIAGRVFQRQTVRERRRQAQRPSRLRVVKGDCAQCDADSRVDAPRQMFHTVLQFVQLDRLTSTHEQFITFELPIEYPGVGKDAIAHFRAPHAVGAQDEGVRVPTTARGAPDADEVGGVEGQLT